MRSCGRCTGIYALAGVTRTRERRAHLGRVEEEVGDPPATDVLVLVRDVGEDDPARDLGPGPADGHVLEVALARRWEAKEPKDRVRVLAED